MADLSDVTAALASLAATACYPNGTSSPSVAGIDGRIYEGWPIPDQLDKDMAAGQFNVSVFPMQAPGATVPQYLNKAYQVTNPVYGVASTVASNVVTLTGTPSTGEFVTLVVDHHKVYSEGGASVSAIATALLADLVADYPGSTVLSGALTIVGAQNIEVRHGAPVTMGQATHRQKHCIIISAWAPNNAARNAIAAAVDNALKATLRITLPDTSQAIMVFDRSLQSDRFETLTVYRRDLYYNVEYATTETFTAYVVTSINGSILVNDLTIAQFAP